MTDFPLEALGPIAFQEVAEALLIDLLGIRITPMGAGRDGGRDAKTDDSVKLRDSMEVIDLHGMTVFQVKHHATLGTHAENASWLWGEIRKELSLWTTSEERARTPNSLVFITNVSLTPYPGSGGRDTIERKLVEYRAKHDRTATDEDEEHRRKREARRARLAKISSIRVLDRQWVNGGLARSNAVRRAFPAMLTAADVFDGIAEFTGTISASSVPEALRDHARQSLTIDGTVWMAEGGDATGSRVNLHNLVVDLPALNGLGDERSRGSLVKLVIDRAERMLRPRLRAGDGKRHLVITGAAGNGKTTTAKFLVQSFRCAMLRGTTLSQGQQEIVNGTMQALLTMDLEIPKHLRWPIRLDLKDMLQRHQLLDGATMLSAIAARISAELDGGQLNAGALESWRRTWPWLVVFDGFDEITDPNSRQIVIERVEQFIEEAEANNADLMVILTTRSLGYNDEMSDELFERVDLDYLNTSEGLDYARRVVRTTLAGDPNRQHQVLDIIESASQNPAQRSLLRTPLQILILTIIVNGAQHLEPDRYGLFSRYFDLAFEREKSKGPHLQAVLTKFEPVIRNLHRSIGFTLHARAESGDTPDPRLTDQELRDLIWAELNRQGFKPAAAGDPQVQEVLNTATHRLVLIAPLDGGYGFEIRSLQELTAGQWLMEEDLDVATRRLGVAAASPHWRNAVLFAAGFAFHSGNSALHHKVLTCIDGLDHDEASRLSGTFPVAPRLALDMVDDGMVRNRPAFRHRLFEIGLRALKSPPEVDFGSIASTLIRVTEDNDDDERRLLADALRSAVAGSPTARRNAVTLRSMVNPGARANFTPTKQAIVAVVDMPAVGVEFSSEAAWANFASKASVAAPEEQTQKRVTNAVATILRTGQDSSHRLDGAAVLEALADPDAAVILDAAMACLADTDERVLDALRREVWPSVTRRPVGNTITEIPHGGSE